MCGGRGNRNRFFATGVPGWQWLSGYPLPRRQSFSVPPGTCQEERDVLMEQSRFLEDRLNALRMRIDALSREKKTE
jgi:hypothetical protein